MPKDWFTTGYLGHKIDELEAVRAELGAVVVDIRMRPNSRVPSWRQPAMVRYFGDNYRWCQAWGSVHFETGPPHTLLNPEAGWTDVSAIRRPVILLCACRDATTCHRAEVARWLVVEHGVAVRELEW